MTAKRKYTTPSIENLELDTGQYFMEWSGQTIDGGSTNDFNYGGEADEEMEADSKKFTGWDAWE